LRIICAVSIPARVLSHKSATAQAFLKAQGNWLLFLPPYSPGLNPIEMAFSKIKAHLRRFKARTFDTLFASVAEVCELFQRQECENWCCQTDENWSQFAAECRTLWRTNLAPLGESRGSVGLEIVSAIERALLVEMVVDGGMNGGEFL
jgi:hypothetical protein